MDIDKIIEENPRVLIDVWAEWCGPCKMTTPIIEELEREVSDVKFIKINADKDREIVAKLGITSIPSFFYYKNGELTGTQIGATNKRVLQELIEEL